MSAWGTEGRGEGPRRDQQQAAGIWERDQGGTGSSHKAWGEGPGRDWQRAAGLRYHLQRVGGWQSDALPHTFLIEELQGMVSARPLRVAFQVGCLFFDNSRACFGWGSCIGCPSEHLGCHRGSVD